jgi:hypothetical protein
MSLNFGHSLMCVFVGIYLFIPTLSHIHILLSSAFFTKYICPTLAVAVFCGSGGERRDGGIGGTVGDHHHHPML